MTANTQTAICWHGDGQFYFAYDGPVATGYWIRFDGTDYGLHLGTKPQARFSQLDHAMDAAESDIRRTS